MHTPANATLTPEYKALLTELQLQAGGQMTEQNYTLENYRVMSKMPLMQNFTLYPGICLAAAERLDLCRVDMSVNVTAADA